MERNIRNKYRICLVQTTSYKDGKEHNLNRAEEIVRQAAEKGASLVVFPELYISGYVADREVQTLCEGADGPSEKRMAELASNYGIHIIYGYPEKADEAAGDTGLSIFNSANLIDDKGLLIGTYRKSHLFLDESVVYTPANEYPVFETELGRIGMLICYDIEFPEPARSLALRGADIIVCISANMAPYYELHSRFSFVRAVENSLPVAYCNYTGSDNRFEYVGRSGLYMPDAELFCAPSVKGFESGSSTEGLIFADVDLTKKDPEGPFDYLGYLVPESAST
jgi:predicted amidohydrolase